MNVPGSDNVKNVIYSNCVSVNAKFRDAQTGFQIVVNSPPPQRAGSAFDQSRRRLAKNFHHPSIAFLTIFVSDDGQDSTGTVLSTVRVCVRRRCNPRSLLRKLVLRVRVIITILKISAFIREIE